MVVATLFACLADNTRVGQNDNVRSCIIHEIMSLFGTFYEQIEWYGLDLWVSDCFSKYYEFLFHTLKLQ